jgi:hypothetical protein
VVSQWPELLPERAPRPWRTIVSSISSVTIGGVIGWSLLFAGLGLWGLAIGAAVAIAIVAVIARVDHTQEIRFLFAYGMAFVLMAWPVLWVVVGLVRYWLTGQSLGN